MTAITKFPASLPAACPAPIPADPDKDKRSLYEISNQILGKGGAGSVVKGIDLRTRSPVAVKTQPASWMAEYEAKLLSIVQKTPHAVPFRNAYYGSPKKNPAEQKHHIVMDLIPGEKIESLNLDVVFSIGRQLLEFFDALHSQGIIYYDLKPGNMSFRPSCRSVTVFDFGGARQMDVNDRPFTTASFRAPEFLLGKPLTAAYDLWTLGCTLFQLFTGRPLIPLYAALPQKEKNLYVLYRIVEILGTPTAAYLSDCNAASQLFDEQLELRKKFNMPPSQNWKEAVRQAGAKTKSTEKQVADFIDLLSSLFSYENRPSATELLRLPLFQKELALHLDYDPLQKCTVLIHRSSLCTKPIADLTPADISTPDLTLDFNKFVPNCLHIPRDPTGVYAVFLVKEGVFQSFMFSGAVESAEINLNIRDAQQHLANLTTKAKRRLIDLFPEEESAETPEPAPKQTRKENVPPAEAVVTGRVLRPRTRNGRQ